MLNASSSKLSIRKSTYEGVSTSEHHKSSSDIYQRLSIIENNLSRVCLQQDALLPLKSLLDFVPLFQRNENSIKSVLQGQQQNQSRLNSMDERLEEISKAMKCQMEDLKEKLEQMEKCVNEKSSFMEQPVSKGKKSVKSGGNNVDIDELKSWIANQRYCPEEEFRKELKNIYTDMGGLKNDVEFSLNEIWKSTIRVSSKQLPFEEQLQKLLVYERQNNEYMSKQLGSIEQELESHIDSRKQKKLLNVLIKLKYQLAASKSKYMQEFENIGQEVFLLEQKLEPEQHSKIESISYNFKQNIEQTHLRIKQIENLLVASEH